MAVTDWLYTHRPKWLGRFAGWLVWGLGESIPLPGRAVPYLIGIQLGSRPHRVTDAPTGVRYVSLGRRLIALAGAKRRRPDA